MNVLKMVIGILQFLTVVMEEKKLIRVIDGLTNLYNPFLFSIS